MNLRREARHDETTPGFIASLVSGLFGCLVGSLLILH
jgi:hypothetical protein